MVTQLKKDNTNSLVKPFNKEVQAASATLASPTCPYLCIFWSQTLTMSNRRSDWLLLEEYNRVFQPQQWPACDKCFLSHSLSTAATVLYNSIKKYQLKCFKYFIDRIPCRVHQPLNSSEPSHVFPHVKLRSNLFFISVWTLHLLEGK